MSNGKNRTIPFLLAGMGCVFLLSGCTIVENIRNIFSVSPKYENTNVILISIDTLRHDHLGCYGYERDTSRNIDKLAEESVLFENFITQANLTPISQMSILTSQYPRVNGMTSFNIHPAGRNLKTLPSILKYYDYFNAAFLSSPEFYFRYNSKDGYMVNLIDEFSKPFDMYSSHKGMFHRDVPMEALGWISENKDKKFFLWLPIGTVHFRYSANFPEKYRAIYDRPGYEPFFNRFGKQQNSIPYAANQCVYKNTYYRDFSENHKLNSDDVDHIISRYDAGIRYTDDFVGRLLEHLNELGLSKKTMIILHSTHGEDLGEHGYFTHYDLYDTEVKNALMIRFPKKKFGGKRVETQVQGLDIMPTVFEYLGIPVNHEAQGTSLIPLIERGDDQNWPDRYAYSIRIPLWEQVLSNWLFEKIENDYVEATFTEKEKDKIQHEYLNITKAIFTESSRKQINCIAIRTKDWKLILRKDKELLEKVSWWAFITGKPVNIEQIELYDLKKDPLEQTNIAQTRQDIVKILKEKLLEWDKNIENNKAQIDNDGKTKYILPYPGE